MIYKSYTLNCYFHRIEKRYISFCSFLATISPGALANFSCSSFKSSGVSFSFKTLTVVFRSSISCLRSERSSSDSFNLCSSFFIFCDSVITSGPLFILEKSSENTLYWAKGAIFCPRFYGHIYAIIVNTFAFSIFTLCNQSTGLLLQKLHLSSLSTGFSLCLILILIR